MSNHEEHLRERFNTAAPHYRPAVESLVEDPDAVLTEAESIFAEMVPDMAYRDDPRHPMADAVFFCNTALAIYLAAKRRGVDAHSFGATFVKAMKANPPPEPPADPADDADRRKAFLDAAAASQEHARPGEFVFEVISGKGRDFDWGMNIRSCAICHAFSKHDAMDLVPYMCATDDIGSDWGDQGLERTGTIAVGAHQCDFRYQQGRQARHLAELYPDRIRVSTKD